MQTAPQFRFFRERHLLQRTILRAVRNADGAVYVDTAQHDHASRRAAKDVHQFFRLSRRTDHKVNHNVGSKMPQLLSAGGELITVAPNLLHASRRGRRAAVKHRHRMLLFLERGHHEPPNETIPANEKDAHRKIKSSQENASWTREFSCLKRHAVCIS